ncbi:hypothetical protein CXB51_031597 [Gossypium anomalum]|uniref:DUF4218 domain-containing protein n=1 Tax=Gossypium anomalum TaxID=47600 RepID=A0A8J5Y4M7_9ROSI|nr:hypothetical protein CXB51_031597 [Gossypium anomalum]
MSTSHSTWLILLIPYNLEPWACMKQSLVILSMVIPSEKGPDSDINVYIQLLIDELKQLWIRVDAFDASAFESFTLRACHRRWLSTKHPFRKQSRTFNSIVECWVALIPQSGKDILKEVEGINSIYGKIRKKDREELVEDIFLSIVKNLKVLNGYAPNISQYVNLKEHKLSNLKSHDDHILIQAFLPICLRGVVEKVLSVIINLSDFFKRICAKSLDLQEVDQLQIQVVLTLCEIEKIFPPSFFIVMIHLVIHLSMEVKLGRPVQYR